MVNPTGPIIRAGISSSAWRCWQGFRLTEEELQSLTYAIWWHHAVYDATASDNEAKSAEMAKRDLRDLEVAIHARDEVACLILLTAGRAVEKGDRLGEILVSIDLAILGAPPEAYDEYALAV